MPIYAKPAGQAARMVKQASAFSKARHTSRNDGKIHSLGTARAYRSALTLACEWSKTYHDRNLVHWDNNLAEAYLAERAEEVSQKTLDLDRQALQILPGVSKLERVHSEQTPDTPTSRAYTPAQVEAICEAQQPHNQLATEIAYAAGLRAHELLTLRPVDDQPASAHRTWVENRFTGREGVTYSVVGKGGLVREVRLPEELATRLESVRLADPRTVIDRGIHYEQHYEIGGGMRWSASFSAASQRELDYSTGAHGLRHSYAQERMDELQGRGYLYRDAMAVVSQEMGHFRPDITLVYLR